MLEAKGKHLIKEKREVIAIGVRNSQSSRKIAKAIEVSPSTVIREVKANRTVREKKSALNTKLSSRCIKYNNCQVSGSACEKCSTKLTTCKHCRTRNCIETCLDYERKMCPTTESWPYVCPEGCPKRAHCGFPKCSYDAGDAHAAYLTRLKSSREGISLTQEELDQMNKLIVPLVRQGQSFEVIWGTHAEGLPVCVRTAYSYQDGGFLKTANIELPRKVRIKKSKDKGKSKRDRIDRTGRTYDDFKELPLGDQVRVVQGDSVEGHDNNMYDILSLHIVAYAFQFYLYKKRASTGAVVAWLDVMERAIGSCEAFEAIFGILLVDRGVEFDDWEGMERSCLKPGQRRAKVFYCDPQATNQKSQAERNHEQLRRILPKGRSDFDKLNVYDVAVCCSHVNSYLSAGRNNKCPFVLAEQLLPQSLLDELGLERVAPDDVVLKPYLMMHAVAQ